MPERKDKIMYLESGANNVPDCFVRLIDTAAPTMLAIHGISRNAAEIAARFAQHPDFAGVNIIAPLFDRRRFGQYQQLVTHKDGQTRSDLALLRLLDALRSRHAMDNGQLMMFGFSGGAQMAHRMAMLYPERVQALCAVSAGWYLLPDPSLPYPYGLQDAPGTAAHPSRVLDLPIRVLVGNQDRKVDETVRMDPEIIARQGSNRLQRARSWTHAMRQHARVHHAAADIEMIVLPGGTHEFGQCVTEAGLIEQTALALLPKQQAPITSANQESSRT